MALQLSTTVRAAMLDAIETAIGTAPVLKFYDLTSTAPANCAASITGTVLVSMTLPSDWMAGASGGNKAKSGAWQTTATAAGTADFYRLFASDGTTCHLQGTVSITGGGGDLTVDNPVLENGQTVTINTFTLAAQNA